MWVFSVRVMVYKHPPTKHTHTHTHTQVLGAEWGVDATRAAKALQRRRNEERSYTHTHPLLVEVDEILSSTSFSLSDKEGGIARKREAVQVLCRGLGIDARGQPVADERKGAFEEEDELSSTGSSHTHADEYTASDGSVNLVAARLLVLAEDLKGPNCDKLVDGVYAALAAHSHATSHAFKAHIALLFERGSVKDGFKRLRQLENTHGCVGSTYYPLIDALVEQGV
jgi:hypothetical protein